MRNILFLATSFVLAGSGCGSSDASNDVTTDSSSDAADDGALHDTAHDTAVVDSAPKTDASDATPDVQDDSIDDVVDAADGETSTVDGSPDSSDSSPVVDATDASDAFDGSDASDGAKGCATNSDCASNEMCDAPTCTGPGTCITKPSIGVFCIKDADPRCGCNGVDYTSTCAAHKAGVRVAHVGSCADTACGATSDCAALGTGYFCSFGVGNCTMPGFCKAEGFCPGFLTAYCTCAGSDVSTNACMADKAGVRLAHGGTCP